MSDTLSGKPACCRLTPQAVVDLDDIWRFGAENWSPDQADRYLDDLARTFEMLVAMPEIARERLELDPPVRIHVHARHLIVYIVENDAVLIIRVLGGRQNWLPILERADG